MATTTPAGDGLAGWRRRRGCGAGGGVLRRREPAQPWGRPALLDTTSTYFERDDQDEADAALRRFGHSKDHRRDLPQIVIGLAVTREGIPVRVWPGSTTDQTVITQVKDDLRP